MKTAPAHNSENGFTLIEMIVAVGLFAIVMVICVSTLFALVNANRKAQALQSVMNNLNISLDNMARSIRMGRTYNCGNPPFSGTRDCVSGGTEFEFEPYGGDPSQTADNWYFAYDLSGTICGAKAICRNTQGGNASLWQRITAPEISIDSMHFYTVGSTGGDTTQPRVIIVVKGTAGAANAKTRSTFHIEVGATQRVIDI